VGWNPLNNCTFVCQRRVLVAESLYETDVP
jgi:hypothetical protein